MKKFMSAIFMEALFADGFVLERGQLSYDKGGSWKEK